MALAPANRDPWVPVATYVAYYAGADSHSQMGSRANVGGCEC